jgi:hypothetical protein
MLRVRRPAGAVVTALLVIGGCGIGRCSRTLTARRHVLESCTARADGAAILCGGETFASLECQDRFPDGCSRLAVRYADGDLASLYVARGDPKFDAATHVTLASDGTRVWFLETEGPFLSQRWREYDVQSGALSDARSAEIERVRAAVARGAAVPFDAAGVRSRAPPRPAATGR